MAAPALFKTDDDFFAPRALLGWVGFSLAAGCVNAGTFLACRSVVGDVTGLATSLAIDLTRRPSAFEFALVLAAFLAGAAAAALAAETWGARRELSFAMPVLLAFVALVGVAFAGRAGAFGAFGAAPGEPGPGAAFAMLGALAAAAGLLNAAVTLATSNAVRATHLTGAATDLATGFVRAALGAGDERVRELRWALLRAVRLIAFAAGGVVAAANAQRLQYDLFMVAAGVLIVALGLTAAPADESPEPAQAPD